MPDEYPAVGFLGLGAMGGPMVARLLEAGYPVIAYDLVAAQVDACAALGARPASAAGEAAAAEIVMTSLPSSEALVRLAEEVLLPAARAGQIFVDLGTVTPPDARRLAAAFAARGAALLDVPVSGGPAGAARGSLRMFAGGDPAELARVRPLLETIGGPDQIFPCGPAGSGQVVKGVNQLAMGLGAAAYLEALALGVRAGVAPELLREAVGGGPEPWRQHLGQIAAQIAAGSGEAVGVKFRELPYYLREAAEAGLPLPLTDALYAFCDAGERVVVDDNRPAPSFWHELTQR